MAPNVNTCGRKAGKICRGLGQLCWPRFLQGWNLLWWYVEWVTMNHDCSWCVADISSPYFSSLFLAVSIQLCLNSLSAVRPKRDLCAVPLHGWESQIAHTALPFLTRSFLAGTFPLGTEQCQLEGPVNKGKMKLSFFFSWAVLLKFLKWAPGLSQSCICLQITVQLLIFVVRTEISISCIAILMMTSFPQRQIINMQKNPCSVIFVLDSSPILQQGER